MANELLASLDFARLIPGSSNKPSSLTPVGILAGQAFPPGQTSTVYFIGRVPNAVALATGLTYTFVVADDPLNPSAGKVCVFGVTVAPLADGTTVLDETVFASSTEDTVSITTKATVGNVTVATLAALVAHFNSLAAGNIVAVRVRRLGTNASETHVGRVVLLDFDARNT